MRKVVMADKSTKYSDSMKHEVGEWYDGRSASYIVTSVEQGKVRSEYGIETVWLHELREATAEEIAERESKQAEWDAKTSDERTEARISNLAERFPNLSW